ncbi:MAG TPA: electron transfer flavoprotein subunit alpha/FixB family protein [Candidatus Polarisedimenticolia bacterium]|nr:electron transfer flavoprotein subunit alpha/FixB family protein [Candidatus Polarisedimenticolia bacterium]
MAQDILVFVECRSGQIKRSSLEAVAEATRTARGLGSRVAALLVGSSVESQVAPLAKQGPQRILIADHESLSLYQPELYACVLADAARRVQAGYVFLSASSTGRDLGPRAAAKLEAGLAADCTHVEIQGGELVLKRPVYSGKALATVRMTGSPSFVTLRPNVFPLEAQPAGGEASIERIEVTPDAKSLRAKTVRFEESAGAEEDLSEASIVVSGGRAMKGPENFALIRDLARALGGSMGASRAAVDAGWVDHQYQVGQTGKVVSPNLYVACGISGAIQHLAGMSSSKTIVAINKDPEAPIFKLADYGIVGDLYEILPRLTEEVRKLKGQS